MAKGYIFDKFFNRKIEGETNLITPEELVTKLAGKANIIETDDILEILDTVKAGDIVVDNDSVAVYYFGWFTSDNNYKGALSSSDDGTAYMTTFHKSNDEWSVESSYEIASTDVLQQYLSGKVNLIKTDDLTSVLNGVEAGDIVVAGFDEQDAFANLIQYVHKDNNEENVVIIVFWIGDDASCGITTYTKSGNQWSIDDSYGLVSTSELNQNKGTKLYKHVISIDEDNVLILVTNKAVLFNNNATIIQKLNEINTEFKNCVNVVVNSFASLSDETYKVLSLEINTSDSSLTCVGYFLANVQSETLSNIESITDTVTPL